MVNYRIVKYCRLCKKRFVVDKSDSKINYCSDCQTRMDKLNEVTEEN